ncbi:MAG: element excision factor XisI family protein, partial [Chloroflexota bacterium]
MDKLVAYREYIKILLKKYGEDQDKPEDSVVTQTVIDEERDHYHLFHAGWNNGYRIYGCYLHFDIINNKIWLRAVARVEQGQKTVAQQQWSKLSQLS